MFSRVNGTGMQIGVASSAAIADGEEVRLKVTVTPADITLQRLTTGGAVVQTLTVATTAHTRSGYFHFGRNGIGPKFRNAIVS